MGKTLTPLQSGVVQGANLAARGTLYDLLMITAPARAAVRFYAELNAHLAPHQRYQPIEARNAEFRECPAWRVYWEGSHYQRMRHWIDELTSAVES